MSKEQKDSTTISHTPPVQKPCCDLIASIENLGDFTDTIELQLATSCQDADQKTTSDRYKFHAVHCQKPSPSETLVFILFSHSDKDDTAVEAMPIVRLHMKRKDEQDWGSSPIEFAMSLSDDLDTMLKLDDEGNTVRRLCHVFMEYDEQKDKMAAMKASKMKVDDLMKHYGDYVVRVELETGNEFDFIIY
jgi:hypothetical protein